MEPKDHMAEIGKWPGLGQRGHPQMTWTPETNTTIWALLTDEQKEAMKAAKYGWTLFVNTTMGDWATIAAPSWERGRVYRALPAPKWEPPAELWALLRPEIVVIARSAGTFWKGLVDPDPVFYEENGEWRWYGASFDLEALNLPDIPAAESLFIRPGRE